MNRIVGLWQSLAPRQRAMLVGSAAATVAAFLMLASFATRPTMTLLYAGLEGGSAGEVLAALDQQGVAYEVRGSAIYVESARRDALRMALAAEGLPANGGAGYELLDSLSAFGTTTQMFDAAYWRARDGELARTITAGPDFRSARVHIAVSAARARPSASVTVSTRAGSVAPRQAKALRYLVASAVPGLAPEDVAVIDSVAGLVLAAGEPPATAPDEREEALRQNVLRLLEARVGRGNAIVEISIDTVSERESITERRIDPQGKVAISTDSEERSSRSSEGSKGAVTVASNLPEGDAGGAAGSAQSQDSETRERVNFDISETTREILRAPGAIRRLSVAVLVNAAAATDPAGKPVTAPRSDAELADLQALVASTVGFDAERGDSITLKSLEFQPLTDPGTEAVAPSLLDRLDVMSLIRIAFLAVVAVVLGLFVLRPLLMSRGAAPIGLPPPGGVLPPPGGVAPARALTGEIAGDDFASAQLPVVGGVRRAGELAAGTADPVTRLRELIAARQDETVEVLRSWIDRPAGEKP